ncbi:unnamed protein product [Clavelina lepadiformis]|uniref:DDB1-and CUL4-associated factor 8 n=1 Tax=Clavelina lepadiformis TaxID=159417 RepID=A0ABP0GK35_CLALP
MDDETHDADVEKSDNDCVAKKSAADDKDLINNSEFVTCGQVHGEPQNGLDVVKISSDKSLNSSDAGKVSGKSIDMISESEMPSHPGRLCHNIQVDEKKSNEVLGADFSGSMATEDKPQAQADLNAMEEGDTSQEKVIAKFHTDSDVAEGNAMEKCKIDDTGPPTVKFKTIKHRGKSKKRSTMDSNDEDSNRDSDSKPKESNTFEPAEAKKQRTGAVITDSDDDDDEFVDAREHTDGPVKRKKTANRLKCDAPSLNDSSSSTDDSSITSSSESDSSSDEEDAEKKKADEEKRQEEEEEWLKKDIGNLPHPKWRATVEMRKREILPSSHYWTTKVCGAYGMVKRFKLGYELDKHNGCVNALHFNQSGSLLASGSDDLQIMLWDWAHPEREPAVMYESGHKSNVFQAKFLPNCGDATVVSSARDGQVRVGDISATGSCRGTKKVAQHRGSAHKLSLDIGQRSSFLSCGEDGVVFGIDLRQDKPDKLVTVKLNNRKIPLYSIHTNPSRSHEFAVSGREPQARVYDRRMLVEAVDENTEPLKLYCPHHLEGMSDIKANITCLVYNWDGSELLCSYNDEDIYLFDTNHSSGAEYVRRYKGHRNSATVKGVNFYGPQSQFVVSGSDCGNIFFWEKSSSRIVGLMEGDKGGVVNVLEPHPSLPVMATSGLDHEVKIWTPSADSTTKANEMPRLKEFMLSNRRDREEDRQSMPDMIDGHMLWFLMRSLRNRTRRIHAELHEENSSSEDELNASSDSGDDGPIERCTQS